MGKFLEAFHLDAPDSLKRFLVMLSAGALTLVRPLLESKGVPVPSEGALEVVCGLAATFILQSGIKAGLVAKAAGDAAAAKVATPDDAAKVLGGTVQSGSTP